MNLHQRFIIWFSAKVLGWRVDFDLYDPEPATGRFSGLVNSSRRFSVLCRMFGHHVYIDDVGGAGFDCCTRCSWVGKCRHDFFADEETKQQIIAQNKKDFGT